MSATGLIVAGFIKEYPDNPFGFTLNSITKRRIYFAISGIKTATTLDDPHQYKIARGLSSLYYTILNGLSTLRRPFLMASGALT